MKVYKNGGGLEPDPIIRKLLEKFDGDLDKAMKEYIASSDNPEKAKRKFERFARRMEGKQFRQERREAGKERRQAAARAKGEAPMFARPEDEPLFSPEKRAARKMGRVRKGAPSSMSR